MKLIKIFTCLVVLSLFVIEANAQCSVCTKTAQDLGEQTGKGLNVAILYLAAFPFAIIGFIGYRWCKMKGVKE